MAREIIAPHRELLPIEARVLSANLDALYATLKSGQEIPRILVASLQVSEAVGRERPPYMLLAGSHRVWLAANLGYWATPAVLLETDQDLLAAQQQGEPVGGMSTLAETRDAYRSVWAPDLERQGVRGMPDFLALPPIESGQQTV